ncbi:MAG: glucans biosynthesis glucosyltransferase MdoH [Rhizobiaceae bacterium]|nr:glucans biosynthesis glucosyltransferase MdoH [Rhizobiaceae bacterium]
MPSDIPNSRLDAIGAFSEPHAPTPRPAPAPATALAVSGLPIFWRRVLVLILNVATIAALGIGTYTVLSPEGIDALEAVMLAGFLFAAPWTVLGFWNAMIGLVLLRGPGNPSRSVYPFFCEDAAARVKRLSSRTALAVCLRNEAPAPIFERIAAMRDSLERTGLSAHFRFVFLSDTSDPTIAAAEDDAFATFLATGESCEARRPFLRRRAVNTGFKAGNIRDFLVRHGDGYDFFLPLDSDSVMSGDVVTRMVASMERHPEIGILQSLVVGMPATSGFARLFQFGMRHGMRSFTMGAAWWNADCGSYWGHNAVIRARAFREHCDLPVLPGRAPLGGHILSHDQLEAVFMRRAGYEVRVLPIETQSYETNPPTLPDFSKRDLRWCQGNMQYWRFLVAPGLPLLSRFQILQAIVMYIAPPAWLAMTLAGTAKGITDGFHPLYLELGLAMFGVIFFLSVAPKIAGVIDVALGSGSMRLYGGPLRFGISAMAELAVSMLLAPIVAVYVTTFLVGLLFGRTITWSGQNRDRLGIAWREAAKAMWPQTLLGFAMLALLSEVGVQAALWMLPVVLGLCLAIPLTVLTASASFGRATARLGLFAIPEEVALPRVIRSVVPREARLWRVAETGGEQDVRALSRHHPADVMGDA